MQKAALILAGTLILGSTSSPHAQPVADYDSLKLTHETVASAVTSGNLTILEGLIHRNAFGFFRDSQLLVELRRGFGPREVLSPVVADISRFVTTPYKADYRVVGDTGVVCITSSLKDPKGEVRHLRVTYVYVFTEGNWRLLSWHSSDLPLKR